MNSATESDSLICGLTSNLIPISSREVVRKGVKLFDPNDSPKWINQVHMEGWKLGIKTFYYLRTDSVIKGDLGSRQADCVSCDG